MAQTISSESAVEQIVDDLTKVNGIGPAVEQRLHNAGIVRYAQLAGMKPVEVISLLKDMIGFTEERILAQDWLGQAKRLAAESGEEILADSSENSKHRQHYAVFTCELLLDRLNQVRRTRVMHVQSQQEVVWPGWVSGKLEGYLIQSAQLNIAVSAEEVEIAELIFSPGMTADLPPAAKRKSRLASHRVLYGVPEITDFQLTSHGGERLGVMIAADQPFSVRLFLDLRQVRIETVEQVRYIAELYVRNLGTSERLVMGRIEGLLSLDEMGQEIEFEGQPLSPGSYNLEVLVTLWPQSQTGNLRNQLVAMTEGKLLSCC